MDSYFLKARYWYVDKYLAVGIQLIYSLVMFVIVAFCVMTSVEEATSNGFEHKIPIIVYAHDQVNYFTDVKGISEKGDSINISVARYLVKKYIMIREGYRYGALSQSERGDRIMMIRANSSRKVFDQYVSYLSPSINPESPVLMYRYDTERIVGDVQISFNKDTERPSQAYAKFTVKEISINGEKYEDWEAKIRFSMNDIDDVITNDAEINFIITDYESLKLSDAKIQ